MNTRIRNVWLALGLVLVSAPASALAQRRGANASAGPTVSNRAPATHLAVLRQDLGAGMRVLRSVTLATENGGEFAVTLASYVEDDETSFVIAYGSTARADADEIQTTSFTDLAGEHHELVRFEPTLVRGSSRQNGPSTQLFLEIAATNERQLAHVRLCDDSLYTEEDDEDDDCAYDLEPEGGTMLVAFDVGTSRIVAQQQLSNLEVAEVGRYRLLDEDDDGVPEIRVEIYACREEPEDCDLRGSGRGARAALAWDAAVRALRDRGRATGRQLIDVEIRTLRYDATSGEYGD